jgi:hypothetical protein
MYGLPKDADLSFLLGKEVCQVAIGSYDVQFNWGRGGLSVWGKFIYKPSASSEIVWQGQGPDCYTYGPIAEVIDSISVLG